ncbi:MAG: lytic transglycosylase domain-containing protein [Bdellovibrionota bacterium]|nr:lytic transglycosylase domain-containing protein [Pseudomonadota bacterium]MDY6090337.1 lytic transglycosylase domain-containing protein [Bdellovibrionota bacterium]
MDIRKKILFVCLSFAVVVLANSETTNAFASTTNSGAKLTLRQRIVQHQIDYISRIIKEHNKNEHASRALAKVIVNVSNELGLDPLLTTAIIKAESTFQPYAKSNKGALGLMQLLPSTGRYISKITNIDWRGIYRLHDVEYNIRLGLGYYKYLEEQFNGNLKYTLIAYNWGPNNTLKAINGEKFVPRTSSNYFAKISQSRDKWKEYYAKEFSKLFT